MILKVAVRRAAPEDEADPTEISQSHFVLHDVLDD
jgi:hypothetical protein